MRDRTKYKNKYRIKSNRLQGWDYSNSGYYFITIVTANRRYVFGEIIDNEMRLSDFGKIAQNELLKSFAIRNELALDNFIIMPNHLHAIVVLEKTKNTNNSALTVETHGRASLQYASKPDFIRKPKSISSFIAGYKSATLNKIDDFIDENNLKINKYNRPNPLWQSNYYDHIIRNEKSYNNIFNYIKTNPNEWGKDSLNPENQINGKP